MTFTVPIRVNSSNVREHWAARAKRVKAERQMTYALALAEKCLYRSADGVRLAESLPVTVTLTRIAPRPLDAHDGLPQSCKGVVDEITAMLGLKSDADPRVTWKYDQCRGKPREYAVRVEVTPRGT